MYISVGKGEKTANTGSCGALVTYLEKENKEAKEQAYFFDHARDQVLPSEVIQTIDQNIQKLGKSDAKYFMVTISPSEKELRHIQNNTEQLRDYARAVMEEYAAAFDRGITGLDLVYFGKIEQGRKFTGADQAVQLGLAREGSQKPGLHTHVHIVVSRKDKSQRLKLSPETNHRANRGNFQGGFDKIRFFMACEKAFDQRFSYMRTQEEKFSYWKEKLNSQPTQQVNTQQVQQVRAAIAQSLQEKPTLLSFTQELLKQSIRPVFEKDAAGQVIGMNYQLTVNQLAAQRGGKIILTRDENSKPLLGVQLKRQVGPKVAQRLMSPAEKDQLVSRGYTDYLTGFISRQGKPFAARLYFNAQNELKFSFTHTIPEIATPIPWTKQELKDFVFPGAYLGVPLTPTIKKQLLTNQVSEFIPSLVTKDSSARTSHHLIPEKALGPGFDFHTLSQQMGHAIQGSVIQEVERFLAQDKSQESLKTVGSVVSWQTDPEKNHTNNQQTHTSSSFLQKAWHKLGFSQEEETADNRLQRLKKRRKKRKILTLK
jgi:hypothetical protein